MVDRPVFAPEPTRHFLLLDAARGIAAISVMIYHYNGELSVKPFFGSAFLAVDLFFMMSGFVLAHAYEMKLLSRDMSLSRFMAVRWIRLYPVYIIGTIIGLAYYASKIVIGYPNAPSIQSLLTLMAMAAVFMPNPDIVLAPAGVFPFAPSSWSLSTEMVVSIIYGCGLFRLSSRALLTVALLSAVTFLPFAYVHGTFDLGWGWSTFGAGVLRTLTTFALGIWLYRVSPRSRITGYLPATALLIVIAVCMTLLPPVGLAGAIAIILMFALFMLCQPRSGMTRFNAAMCRQLGRFSYPIYVLHTPVLLWAYAVAKQAHLNTEAIGRPFGIAEIIVTLLLSRAVLAIDEPVRQVLSRKIKRRTPVADL